MTFVRKELTMGSILVCDDDKEIVEAISIYLTSEGLDVVKAYDGMEALSVFKANDIDLILIDIMMPKLSGTEALREIRKTSNLPALFLTALGEEQDFLEGFKSGCDDYIVKPFPLSVIFEKSMALIKRYYGTDNEHQLRFGAITLDLAKRKAFTDGREITLSSKDFDILLYILSNKGAVVSRDLILTKIWGYDFDGDSRVIDTHIKRIRKALGEYSDIIKTAVGLGYYAEAEVKQLD